jgi:hypothetical protein
MQIVIYTSFLPQMTMIFRLTAIHKDDRAIQVVQI